MLGVWGAEPRDRTQDDITLNNRQFLINQLLEYNAKQEFYICFKITILELGR